MHKFPVKRRISIVPKIFCDNNYIRCLETSIFFIVIMDSLETKDLQISLHTTLSALSLRKDLGIPDDTSSMTSSFTTISSVGSRNSPPPFISGSTIPLHLADWRQFATSPLVSPNDGCSKARKIFQKFVDVAKEHGLEETPYVKMLEDSIAVCDRGIPK